MKASAARAVALVFALAVAVPLFGQARRPVPPAPTQWVTDTAGLLSSGEVASLNATLREFEARSGAQFIVYIIPTLDGYPVEEFTVRAAHEWGVGQDKYDNGLVLFLFPRDRTARVEVGYGLEGSITDAFSRRVIDETMAPYFKKGQWYEGLVAGTDRIMHQIETNEEPVGVEAAKQSGRGFSISDIFYFLIILFLFLSFIRPRRRRGGCMPLVLPMGGGGVTWGGGGGGFSGGSGGFGGFSGGGGGFGGGGATGSW